MQENQAVIDYNKATVQWLGLIDYNLCWQRMQNFTEQRESVTQDEFWLVEHPPVFTLGLAGLAKHLLTDETNIPVVRTDRGGQITYHGPQQVIIYLLIDLRRQGISVRELVTRIESGVIIYLSELDIAAYGDREAPGVYVANKKIASLGLKIRKGCSYHGLSFNFNVNKAPFNLINPCGYSGLQVINLTDILPKMAAYSMQEAAYTLAQFLQASIYK